jgi:hypothetical protein
LAGSVVQNFVAKFLCEKGEVHEHAEGVGELELGDEKTCFEL